MPDDGRPRITTAQSPFDDVDADIVLHTSDHVDFRLFRRILVLSSPFFQGMFALPQPFDSSPCANNSSVNGTDNTHSDGAANPPSIDVSESSQTLDTLLRFLYPNTLVHHFEDLVHARNVAVAASKYVMSVALGKIADKLRTQYAATHPFEVYFIAWQMGWEDVARDAARYSLDEALVMPVGGGDALIRGGTLDYPGAGIAYHRLEMYRYGFHRALEERMDQMELFKDNASPIADCECDSGDSDPDGISRHCLRCWIAQYLANIKQAVSKCPGKDTLGQRGWTPGSQCQACSINKAAVIATARLEVAAEVENVLSKVKLCFGS